MLVEYLLSPKGQVLTTPEGEPLAIASGLPEGFRVVRPHDDPASGQPWIAAFAKDPGETMLLGVDFALLMEAQGLVGGASVGHEVRVDDAIDQDGALAILDSWSAGATVAAELGAGVPGVAYLVVFRLEFLEGRAVERTVLVTAEEK